MIWGYTQFSEKVTKIATVTIHSWFSLIFSWNRSSSYGQQKLRMTDHSPGPWGEDKLRMISRPIGGASCNPHIKSRYIWIIYDDMVWWFVQPSYILGFILRQNYQATQIIEQQINNIKQHPWNIITKHYL